LVAKGNFLFSEQTLMPAIYNVNTARSRLRLTRVASQPSAFRGFCRLAVQVIGNMSIALQTAGGFCVMLSGS
jgi:hypothetical protein